MNTYTTKLPSY